jgi:hypothetical protein
MSEVMNLTIICYTNLYLKKQEALLQPKKYKTNSILCLDNKY